MLLVHIQIQTRIGFPNEAVGFKYGNFFIPWVEKKISLWEGKSYISTRCIHTIWTSNDVPVKIVQSPPELWYLEVF